MIAVCKIRDQPHYRHDAFIAGLKKTGYQIVPSGVPRAKTDLLVIWNRYGHLEGEADRWEALGGSVLVCENGYIGKDSDGLQLYAIAVHGHNGSGWFPVGSEDRFSALGIEVKPWRLAGEHVLICGQRGIGSRRMASPMGWHDDALRKLRAYTTAPLRIRLHPGRHQAPVSLEADLADAWACAIWSSSSGVRALTLGVPILFDAPSWICAEAAGPLKSVSSPKCDEAARARALHRMAHAQWTVAEIASGEPFARIKEKIGEAKW